LITSRSASARIRQWFETNYAMACAIGLFVWLVFLGLVLPIDADEAVYHFIAKGILDGRWPYRDLFDHKPPLIYVWHVPSAMGLGIAGERLIAAFATAASVPVLASVGRRHLANERQVRLGVLAYVAFLANPYLGLNANTEAFSLLPIVGAVAVPSAFGAGLLLGVAIMTKFAALSFVPVLLMIWWGRSLPLVAGIAVVALVVSLPFIPIWDEYVEANVTFNLDYGDQFNWSDRLSVLFVPHPLLVLGALPVWLAAAYGAAKSRTMLLIVWVLCGYLSAKLPGYDFTHYYILMAPPLALLAGQGLDAYLIRRPWTWVSPLSVASVLSLGIVAAVALTSVFTRDDFERYMAERTLPAGELYVLGHLSEIYVYADREPQRRIFFSVPLVVNEEWGAIERQSLIDCPPAVVVIPHRSQEIFPIGWIDDIRALYGERDEYSGGTLLTGPISPCETER
jgi:4-amino-4-deoxy-L-arabinose transferase-like glycosyltransferase